MYAPITGVGDGSAPVVNLTFDYLDQDHIKASVDGVEVSYTWTGASQITFDDVVAVDAEWRVYRFTPIAIPAVDFMDSSVLTEADLDASHAQLRYHQQEVDAETNEALAQAAADAAITSLAVLAGASGSNLVGFNRGLGTSLTRTQQSRGRDWTSVKDWGAVGDGVTDDTAAIQTAVDDVGAAGGGTIYFPEGTYLVSNGNPTALNWDNQAAIWVKNDNVHLVGAGRGATTLKLADGGDAHIIKFGQREEAVVIVTRGSVKSMKLDGNRANQTQPTELNDHWHAIDVASGSSKIHLSDLHIVDAQYYGIGFQRTSISDCLVVDVDIENTGADGLDWKNDASDGVGNVIRNVTVRNHGLASAAISTPQAGIDVRSGVYVENVAVFDMTASTDLVGVRVHPDGDGSSFALPAQPTKVRGVTVTGSDGATSVGVRINARNTQLSMATIRNVNDGVKVSRDDCRLDQIDVQDNLNSGIYLTADSLIALEADTTVITGLVSRGNGYGVIYDSVDNVTVIGGDVRGNTNVNHDIRAGSSYVRILGGSVTGAVTSISDAGTNTVIQRVSGARTRNTAIETAVPIDAVGSQTLIIPHGLNFTPAAEDVTLSLKRESVVTDWALGYMWTVSADTNNLSVQFNVADASATVGATVAVVATIATKGG